MIGEFGAWTAYAGLGHPAYGGSSKRQPLFDYVQAELVSDFFTARVTVAGRGRRVRVRLLSSCCSRILLAEGQGRYCCEACGQLVLSGSPPMVEWHDEARRRDVLESWVTKRAHVLNATLAVLDFETLVDSLEPALQAALPSA